MRKFRRSAVAAIIAVAAGFVFTAQVAHGVPTGLFAGAITEGFEGLSVSANNTLASGFFEPGVLSSFTFASGATLTVPIPNPGFLNAGVLVGDFSLGAGTFALAGNGSIGNIGDVPNGTAYMGLNGVFADGGPIEFTLPGNVSRVGALVTGGPGNITMDVLTSGGVLIESHTIPTVAVSSWGTNFLGINTGGGIGIVRFRGADGAVIDQLTWDSNVRQTGVPEPVTAALGLMGLGVLGMATRRRVV